MKSLFILLVLMLARTLAMAELGILASNALVAVSSQAASNFYTFKEAITADNYSFLGFHSTNEVSQATLANPIPVHSLSLSLLRNYHLGDDFSTLLEHPPSGAMFPIMVGTNVRSSAISRFDRTGPEVRAMKPNFGQRKLIRELMGPYRSLSIPPVPLWPHTAPIIVEVPVFDIWFIGYADTEDRLVLLATIDLPLGPVTINRGQPVTQAAMLHLATVALRYNGLPN